jgi:hypothetical protein
MIEVPESPLIGSGEIGTLRGFFLGNRIPLGAQTVLILTGDTNSQHKTAVAISVTASTRATKIEASESFDHAPLTTTPSITLPTGASVECFVAGVLHSGTNNGSTTPGAGHTEILEILYNAQSCNFQRRTVNSTGGNVDVNWTQDNDDAYTLAVALTETGIAFDAASDSGSVVTGDVSFTHTPVGTPAGILVLAAINVVGGSASATYGGRPMVAVPNSPFAATLGNELATLYGFFLGEDIPAGAQTVFVTTDVLVRKLVTAISVIAQAPVRVLTTGTFDSASTTLPTIDLIIRGLECFIAGIAHSGINAVVSMSPGANSLQVAETTFDDLQVASCIRNAENPRGPLAGIYWAQLTEEARALGVALTAENEEFRRISMGRMG